MTDFQHGISARFYYHTYDMSCFTEQVEQQLSRALAEYRPLCANGVIRVPGHRDYSIVLTGGAFTSDFDEFAFSRYTEDEHRPWVLLPQGDLAGSPVYIGESIGENQQRVAGDDIVRLPIAKVSTGNIYRGLVLRELGEETTSPSDEIDDGASSPDGLVGVLMVTEMDGTDPELDVAIEHSDDDGATDPYTEVLTFTTVEDPGGSEIVRLDGTTLKRYVRATWLLTGTSPEATFFVAYSRL